MIVNCIKGHHRKQMMSPHDGGKAGIWNYWRVDALKWGWAGTLLAEIKFFAMICIGFCFPWMLTQIGMTKKFGPPILEETD